jgi:hypothetical protein
MRNQRPPLYSNALGAARCVHTTAQKFAARHKVDFSNSKILVQIIHSCAQAPITRGYLERSPRYVSLTRSLQSKAPQDSLAPIVGG